MIDKSSLQISDDAAAAVQKTPHRVTLESIEGKIDSVEFVYPANTPHMTIAVVKLKNGFTVLGESAPADPANFNVELGQKFARESAVRKIWPLEGYALCEKLSS